MPSVDKCKLAVAPYTGQPTLGGILCRWLVETRTCQGSGASRPSTCPLLGLLRFGRGGFARTTRLQEQQCPVKGGMALEAQ